MFRFHDLLVYLLPRNGHTLKIDGNCKIALSTFIVFTAVRKNDLIILRQRTAAIYYSILTNNILIDYHTIQSTALHRGTY